MQFENWAHLSKQLDQYQCKFLWVHQAPIDFLIACADAFKIYLEQQKVEIEKQEAEKQKNPEPSAKEQV